MQRLTRPRILALAVLAACLSVASQRPSPAAESPNIVLIMADDLGYAELGCYGQKKIKTPSVDKLAAEGMRFTQFYSGAPVCAPARCVLLTGKHSGHAYIRANGEVKPEGQRPIPAEEVTIAELLKKDGYATAAVGKWGLGMVGTTGDPNKQGFDLFFGYNCQRHAHSYYPPYLWHNDKRIKLKNNPPVPGHARLAKGDDPKDPASYAKFKGTDYTPDRMIDAALGFVRENKDRPFFLYYPTPIPHLALHIPDEELKPYLGKWDETPFTGGGYTPHRTPRAAYAAMITRMDTEVGRIMSLLDELKLADNTLVIFTSDNGTTHLGKEADYTFFKSVGPLRGLKGSVYEGGIRVPMVVRWPGHIKPGTVSDHACAAWDLLPTLCKAVGVKPPAGIDGVNLLPTFTGKGEQSESDLYWEFPSYGGQQAVRIGDWKGVRTKMSKGNRKIELYDLAKDIGEKNDVAADHPDIVKRIAKIMRTGRTSAPIEQWNRYLAEKPVKPKKKSK